MPKLVKIPDVRTIKLGHYTLHATGVDIKGKPSYDEHQGVWDFATRAQRAGGFWLAALLKYAKTREDWREKRSQLSDSLGLSEKTLRNIEAVGNIDPSRRREDVEFGHHEAVASLEPSEQTEWLEKAASHGWTVREMRLEIRASRRRKVIEGQAILEGQYRVIYADPPWSYNDRGQVTEGTAYKRAEAEYPCMTITDLCKLPVEAHTTKNAVLFLWATSPMLLYNPGPREVIEAWGFKYKTSIVWDKVLGNFGHYVHGSHELLLICTRGSCLPDQPTPSPDSVQTIRRSDVHSEKPEEFRQIIEKLYTTGPRLELFGRKPVEGWSVFGNDSRLWLEQRSA